jgi:multidrug resistance efflux pump
LDTRLAHYVLRALASGVVTDVQMEPGEVVAAGTPVATVADVDHPFADVFVPQGRMGAVRLRAPARLRVDAFPTSFPGRVEHVAEQTEFTPRYLFSPRERPNLVVRVRVRVDSMALPLTHFLRIVRGITLEGSTFEDSTGELRWLAGILLALLVPASLRFRKKLA